MRTRNGLVAGGVLLIVAALVCLGWPERTRVGEGVPSPRDHRIRPAPEVVRPAVRGAAPGAPEPAVDPALEAARAFASASGRTFLTCPEVQAGDHGLVHPGRCADRGAGLSCAVGQPDGAVPIRDVGPADPANPLAAMFSSEPPLSVLRWWTDPDGTTHCAEEDAVRREVRVRIVDASGRPLSGGVMAGMSGAEAGPDGRASLEVWSSAPLEVTAISGWTLSDPVWVAPGDGETDIPVAVQAAATEESAAEEMDDRRHDAFRAEAADLEATLAAGGLSPEAEDQLRAWLEQVRGLLPAEPAE